MKNKYLKLTYLCGRTIEDCVVELLGYKSNDILASGEFNGITLYSDTVTMDSAYLEITGKTKDQWAKDTQDRMDKYDRQAKEHKERMPELTIEWMKKGREVLTEDKWAYWDEIVPIRLSDLYNGMELGNCLDIVKVLNDKQSLEEATVMIRSQGHSGMSFGLVCSMVKEFSSRGNEFMEYVNI